MTTVDPPPSQYRIAEVARLSGFTPATLRFYEQAGVLAAPERTPAGYRLYGDRDLERLRLIARAKELGCTLEEIADLVEAWDSDDCGPVKHRLRALVHTKVHAVQAHLAEQATFAAQLQATAAALADRPVDGPCDDTCGCTTATTTATAAAGCGDACGCATDQVPARAGLAERPDADDAAVPIACSLHGDAMGSRLQDWQDVLANVIDRQDLPGGVRLVFGEDPPLGDLARLAAAEQACCPFFAFGIVIDHRGVALEVTAPADGQDLLATVFGVAR